MWPLFNILLVLLYAVLYSMVPYARHGITEFYNFFLMQVNMLIASLSNR